MATGLSLNIGVSHPDPASYKIPWEDLQSCEKNAREMCDVAHSCGFWTKPVLAKEATANNILAQIEHAASILQSEDIFLLSYAGHGSQVPDQDGDEDDGLDETWVAYDRMIIDDELFRLWNRFRSGVRIFVISDSCQSGTITSLLEMNRNMVQISRTCKIHDKENHKRENQTRRSTLDCTVLSLSACQDTQIVSFDPGQGGLFTNAVLSVWNNGAFQDNYGEFFRAISALYEVDMRNPNYRVIGKPNYSFEEQRPFTI